MRSTAAGVLGLVVMVLWVGLADAATSTKGTFSSPHVIPLYGTQGPVTTVPGMSAAMTTVGGATGTGEPVIAGGMNQAVWFQWTPNQSGTARVTVVSNYTEPYRFRPGVTVYSSTGTVASLTQQSQGLATAGKYSATASWVATASTVYMIQVDGIRNSLPPYINEGTFTLDVGIGASTAATGASFLPLTGWWYNTNLVGVAVPIEFRFNRGLLNAPGFYAATVVYDQTVARSARWFSAAGQTQLGSNDVYNSIPPPNSTLQLVEYANGPNLSQTSASPSVAGNVTSDFSIFFSSAVTGTMNLTPVGQAAVSIPIKRYVFPNATIPVGTIATLPAATTPSSGWWMGATDPGRGYFIEIQNDAMLLGVMGYHGAGDVQGKSSWQVSTGKMASATTYTGRLFEYAGGVNLTELQSSTPAVPGLAADRGDVSLTFTSSTAGKITLPGGIVISISKYLF